MKQIGKLFLSCLTLLALTGCSLPSGGNNQGASSEGSGQQDKENSAIKISRLDNARFDLVPTAPLVYREGTDDILDFNSPLTNASFNHNTGDMYGVESTGPNDFVGYTVPLDGDGKGRLTGDYYLFAKATITVPEDLTVYFDAEHSSGQLKQGKQASKSLRICFYTEEAAFVYAPFQDANKCSYLIDTEMHTATYGGELLDQNSTSKISLPGKEVTMIIWFDGNDENVTNDARFDDFRLILAFTAA